MLRETNAGKLREESFVRRLDGIILQCCAKLDEEAEFIFADLRQRRQCRRFGLGVRLAILAQWNERKPVLQRVP